MTPDHSHDAAVAVVNRTIITVLTDKEFGAFVKFTVVGYQSLFTATLWMRSTGIGAA